MSLWYSGSVTHCSQLEIVYTVLVLPKSMEYYVLCRVTYVGKCVIGGVMYIYHTEDIKHKINVIGATQTIDLITYCEDSISI